MHLLCVARRSDPVARPRTRQRTCEHWNDLHMRPEAIPQIVGLQSACKCNSRRVVKPKEEISIMAKRYGLFALLLSGAVASSLCGPAGAQSYPTPDRIGFADLRGQRGGHVSRAFAEIVRREKLLPQPFVVDNRTGGASVIGYNYFKTKRGDPYLMLAATGTILLMAYAARCQHRAGELHAAGAVRHRSADHHGAGRFALQDIQGSGRSGSKRRTRSCAPHDRLGYRPHVVHL